MKPASHAATAPPNSCLWLLLLALTAGLPASGAEAMSPLAKALGLDSDPPVVHDTRVLALLMREGERLRENGGFTPLADLKEQLSRRRCSLALPEVGNSTDPGSVGTWLPRQRPGVLAVVTVFKCDRCPRWHPRAATGFMLTADGTFATCHHVVEKAEGEVLFVMTGDGRVAPVKEVLATNARADVAILQAEGAGFTPLALGKPLPSGEPVLVLSHPQSHFYALSQGVVSRHYERGRRRMMAITADFARGSSGAPVFDAQGRVVAMVASTDSVYYEEEGDVQHDLQMVFKQCIPVEELLRLIEETEME